MACVMSLIICSCMIVPSFASSTADARNTLETSIARVMDFIKNPGYSDANTRQDLNKKIEKELYTIFDFKEFSMRTVGQRWKTFTPEQQQNFVDAFADLLFRTYLDRIEGYSGERIAYVGEIANKDVTRVEVRTTLALDGNRVVPIAYRMLLKNGKWYVYDVLIEGVSLVKNYRTQFGEILSNESPEVLTVRIRERGAALRNKSNEGSN